MRRTRQTPSVQNRSASATVYSDSSRGPLCVSLCSGKAAKHGQAFQRGRFSIVEYCRSVSTRRGKRSLPPTSLPRRPIQASMVTADYPSQRGSEPRRQGRHAHLSPTSARHRTLAPAPPAPPAPPPPPVCPALPAGRSKPGCRRKLLSHPRWMLRPQQGIRDRTARPRGADAAHRLRRRRHPTRENRPPPWPSGTAGDDPKPPAARPSHGPTAPTSGLTQSSTTTAARGRSLT